jgi:glycerol uptake facilitator-like aquaporin
MMRDAIAEALGALLLAATVIGSGIMAGQLAGGNTAVALLANTLATVAALATLIALFGPISGAHFNPVVTLHALATKQISTRRAAVYVVAQIAGCSAGALLAHAMFALPLVQASTHARTGAAQWLSELIATAGLVLVVARCPSVAAAAWRVPLWIGAAYWFTASTSFANPAITIARAMTDSFSGIRPDDVMGFILAQLTGGLLGALLARYFAPAKEA